MPTVSLPYIAVACGASDLVHSGGVLQPIFIQLFNVDSGRPVEERFRVDARDVRLITAAAAAAVGRQTTLTDDEACSSHGQSQTNRLIYFS